MFNISQDLPTREVVSRRNYASECTGDDVAASVRAVLAKSFTQILKKLKVAGVNQSVIAAEMGWDKTIVSQIKSGRYNPSLKQLDKLLDVLNRHAPEGKEFSPSDLFRDPEDIVREVSEELRQSLLK